MAPRDPSPFAFNGEITDTGKQLNLTAAATHYSHGLTGVDQTANYAFVNVLVGSFMILLGITFAYRWLQKWNAKLRHLFSMGREADQRYWMYDHTHFWPRTKKNLVYAPLWKVRHNKEIQLSKAMTIGTLPSRYHSILLLLYLASNIAYCVAINWSNADYEVIAELRGRSGILAAINLIPTVLFALRNNPLIPLLGGSYDTFNLLHRWCARVMVFESVVHTICWGINNMKAAGQEQVATSLATSTSYRWGMVSTCVFAFIFISSSGPLRHAFYETFLTLHRVMVLVGLVGVYVHLKWASLPQTPYVILCFVLWSLEWVWRVFRIIYFNFRRQYGVTKVKVEALPAEACRVTFELARPWRWTPGCHVHAYLPTISLWSSHPFSIAWAENRSREAPLSPREIEMEKMPEVSTSARPPLIQRQSNLSKTSAGAGTVTTIAEVTHKPQGANIALPRDANVTSVSLVMRARTGMTRQLYEKARASKTGTITTWGAIEGPYGGHESLSSYGTVVLFAGGVGITHCIGYVHHMLLQHQAGFGSTRKLLLIWSVPNTEALEWVRMWMEKILKMEGRKEILRIQLFVTKPRHRNEVKSASGSIQMFPGRCNPETIIQKEMRERIGAMGVTVCGPGAFADSVRKSIRAVVDDGCIDFVEEAFTY